MKIKQIISIFIITLMLTATLPITAFAQSSVGSTSLDTNIGEDVIQGQHTQYDEVEVNETQTQVYLTVEDSDLIVSLPTTVILSGTPDEQGKYIGKYSVGVAGDMSGDKIVNIEQQDGLVNVKGGNCANGVNDTSAIVNINGGTYSSPNHGGLYNANCKSINIKNAIMYNSKTSGEKKDAPCVAYGGLYSSGAGNITITNSKILGGNHCIRIKNEGSGSANVLVSNSYLEGQNDVLSLAAGTFTVGENVTLKSKTGKLLEANPAGTLVDPYNVFQLQ